MGNNNGNEAILHSRKQKFMQHQLSKSNAGSAANSGTAVNILGSSSGGNGLQNAKHKVNLSADINLGAPNPIGQTPLSNQNQNKQTVGYDRIKGLTPASVKSGQAIKNNFHLQN